MKNRYGDEYDFEKVSEGVYTITGNLGYWRFGGKEGQEHVDMSDLGFVDPSGGPFIARGCTIDGRKVVRIHAEGDKIYFDVE